MSKQFMVEAVQLVAHEEVNSVAMTMKKLIKLLLRMKCRGDCKRPSWDERKCNPCSETKRRRKLGVNPTDASLSDA